MASRLCTSTYLYLDSWVEEVKFISICKKLFEICYTWCSFASIFSTLQLMDAFTPFSQACTFMVKFIPPPPSPSHCSHCITKQYFLWNCQILRSNKQYTLCYCQTAPFHTPFQLVILAMLLVKKIPITVVLSCCVSLFQNWQKLILYQ